MCGWVLERCAGRLLLQTVDESKLVELRGELIGDTLVELIRDSESVVGSEELLVSGIESTDMFKFECKFGSDLYSWF